MLILQNRTVSKIFNEFIILRLLKDSVKKFRLFTHIFLIDTNHAYLKTGKTILNLSLSEIKEFSVVKHFLRELPGDLKKKSFYLVLIIFLHNGQ